MPRALAGLAAAVVCVLPGCAGSAPAATTGGADAAGSALRLEVQVDDGRAGGDTGRVQVGLGTAVTLEVTSDAADEVHVHGYDEEAALEPGIPAELSFDATVPGVFEVELHDAGTVLLTLQVS